jgi:hypothetical protein
MELPLCQLCGINSVRKTGIGFTKRCNECIQKALKEKSEVEMAKTLGAVPHVEQDLDDLVQVAGSPEQAIYDPIDETMDPASPRWNAREYFRRQPKMLVFVHRDPSDTSKDPQNKNPVRVPFSINGYTLPVPTGVPVLLPRDFAEFIVEIGLGVGSNQSDVAEIG